MPLWTANSPSTRDATRIRQEANGDARHVLSGARTAHVAAVPAVSASHPQEAVGQDAATQVPQARSARRLRPRHRRSQSRPGNRARQALPPVVFSGLPYMMPIFWRSWLQLPTRPTKSARILPGELSGTLVADLVCDGRDRVRACRRPTPSFEQAQALFILQR